MQVLFATIYDVSRSGGLASHVAELSATLRRSGLDVRVVTPRVTVPRWKRRLLADAPRLPLRFLARDSAYLHFLRWNRRFVARAIGDRLAAGALDVIHCHDPIAALAAGDAIAATARGDRAERPRLVLTVHGDLANMAVSDGAIDAGGRAQRMAEAFEADAYRRAGVLITVDGRLRDHCRTLGGERPIEVIRNFTDTERFRPAAHEDRAAIEQERRALGLEAGDDVLLVARRLVTKNGVIHAVRAMAILAERRDRSGRRAVMLIAGRGGPERAAIAAEANRIGPHESSVVRLLGDVGHARLAVLYRLSAAAVVPSVPDAGVVEATSMTALEAMSSGLPVIASGIGGLAEIIEDGLTGFLVPPGSPDAIAEAAARVLDDAALAARLGAAARAFVEREHSSIAAARRIAALYGPPPVSVSQSAEGRR